MRFYIHVYAVLCAITHRASATTFQVQQIDDSDVARRQLERIYKETNHMKYGKCWTKALEELRVGCRNLTDEMQRRIAYAFARCHLQSSGREIAECPQDEPVSKCTAEAILSDTAFNAYTEFFTHTQQICFHLQSQVWHEATETTISRLADNSAEVANSLEESSVLAKEMVVRQNATLQNQQELLRNERLLRENMHQSVLDVQRSHEETKNVIREQRALFLEVFDRVAALQKTVLGEFTSVYTFGFYIGAAFLSYILTSTHRTESARIWLFILLTLNFLSEKAVVHYQMSPFGMIDGVPDNTVMPEIVYHDIWLCRKVFTILALVTMFVCVIRYKDYNKINNKLLNDIKRQNETLQELLKEQGIHSPSIVNPIQSLGTPNGKMTVAKVSDNSSEPHAPVTTTTIVDRHHLVTSRTTTVGGDESFSTSTTAYSHYDSEMDDTFVAQDLSRDSSYSSYQSVSESSRRSSLALGDLPALLRSSTPNRESPYGSSHRRSRRSSTMSDMSIIEKLKENVEEVQGIIVGGHNLRQRRSLQTHNPVMQRESAADFARAVAKATIRRRALLK